MPMPSSVMRSAQRSPSTCQLHPHLAARPVVLDGVAEQVDEHLAQPHPVGEDEDLAAGDRRRRDRGRPRARRSTDLDADARRPAAAPSTARPRPTSAGRPTRASTVIWPDSTRDRSSTSLTSASRCAPAFSMCWMRSSCCSDGGSAASRRSSCEKPSTALSGVRSSWLMRERNSVLARLDASSASRAWRSARAVCSPVTSRSTAVSSGPRSVSWRESETSSGNSWPSARRPNSSRTSPLADVAEQQLLGPCRFRRCADGAE